MKITLYAAAEIVRSLLEQIDENTGELPEGFGSTRTLVAEKAQACAAFYLSNNAEADMVESHAKALLERVKTARKRSNWLKQYLQVHMTACGISEIKADDGTFRATLAIGRDEAVDIFDEAQLTADYMREKISITPDKTEIAKAIKEGIDVPGAMLVWRDRLTIK